MLDENNFYSTSCNSLENVRINREVQFSNALFEISSIQVGVLHGFRQVNIKKRMSTSKDCSDVILL